MKFPLHPDIKQALKGLIRDHGERDEPFAFAGRSDILEDIQEIANANKERPKAGQTFVVNGPPGAGKTALLRELAKRWDGEDLIQRWSVPNDDSIDHLWIELAAKVTGEKEDNIRASVHKARTKGGGVDLSLAKGEVSETKSSTLPPINICSCADIQKLSRQGETKSVIVCIDEIQNIRADSKLAAFVQDLHTQESLPILLVCAGLSNSTMRLDEAGISRLTAKYVQPIGRLTAEETLEVTRKSLGIIAREANLLTSELIARYAEEIGQASDQWPRHLTCYLHGLCEALAGHAGPDLGALTVEEVLAYGNDLREAYYATRLTAFDMPIEVVRSLYDQVDMGMDKFECEDFFDKLIERSDRPSVKRRFKSGTDALEQALRSGILALGQYNQCEIPIPSMKTFMVARAREARAS